MKKIFTLFSALLMLGGLSAAAQEYNVTFQVNMNDVTDAFTTPEVNGTFNNWCGNCAPLADDDGDGIWSITIALPAGQIEFKYAADNWNIQETLLQGSSCTLTTGQFTNRVYVVSQDVTLPPVCWGSCDDCGINNGPYNVEFNVDMSEVTAPFTTPEVNGTFNNWCGGCAPMSDEDGDGIWTITIPLSPGTYEYKYAYDAWAGQETLTAGSPCTVTVDAFTNRSLTVSEEMTMSPVCWGSCASCTPVGVTEIENASISIYPNPASSLLNINAGGFEGVLNVYDITGKQVIAGKQIFKNTTKVLDISELSAGQYYFSFISNGEIITQTVTVSK